MADDFTAETMFNREMCEALIALRDPLSTIDGPFARAVAVLRRAKDDPGGGTAAEREELLRYADLLQDLLDTLRKIPQLITAAEELAADIDRALDATGQSHH